MALAEFLDGESLTGKQAAAIFFGWLGLVVLAGLALVLSLPV
ncbi:hypothetical protein [Halovivax cerinus]|uniref:Uncharacterized protein n=1 Tax=Halovivax cerinus TaxID=1487865 RepID=A0ABD5NJ24_9EURY|nr:hypothetical protein [Halovivax cerinus]